MDGEITANQDLIPDCMKLVPDSCTDNLVLQPILALIHLNTPFLQTIGISTIMNVDFIPSFIQE